MNEINKLGLKVMGVTVLVLVVVFGAYWGIKTIIVGNDETLIANRVPAPTALPDADGDGLPDKYEASYRTDVNNSDTDGDGVSDLAEIRNGTDPSIAGAVGESKPATGEDVVLSAGQVAGTSTFTQQYLATLPTDAAREDVLDKLKLEAFVNTHEGTLLPELAEGTIKVTQETGKDAIERYLNAVSASHNNDLEAVTNDDIEAALTSQLQQDRAPLATLVVKLEHNIETLKNVPAPQEVSDVHKKLVGATQALGDSVAMLRDLDNDFVGAMIATKKIDELGGVFQEIGAQVTEMEGKYGL